MKQFFAQFRFDHFSKTSLFLLLVFSFSLLLFSASNVQAGILSFVSDSISNSAPSSTTTSHSIQFTATTAVPPGGHITLTFEGFTIPATLSFADMDLAVASPSPGPFTDRTLAVAAGPTNVGVAVSSGLSGSITFTLGSNPGEGLLAGDTVKILIGDVATYGGVGTQFIESPASIGSHHIRFITSNAANTVLDSGSTLVAIVEPVGMWASLPVIEAVRSNGLPTGLIAGTNQTVWLSLNTDIPATCRYATTSGITYANMLGSTVFTDANGMLLHYRVESVATNTIYSFYVRCQTPSLIANTTDYLIQFEVGVVPGDATSTPPPPPPPPSSGGGGISGPGGGGGLYLNGGDVTLEGRAAPNSSLVFLQDGVIARETTVSQTGDFSEKFTNLPRGTYTWGVYIRDTKGRLSSTYSSTIYLIARTNNIIAPIFVSPTISAATTTVPLGDPVVLSGYGIPLSPVQVLMNMQGQALTGKVVTGTTTANGDGSWSLTLSSDGLAKGTYEVKALSKLLDGKDQSLLSPILYVGMGSNPNPDFTNRSDLNKDKKVNLIDFSILLFNWKTSDSVSDINQDGTVDLVDFSIMLSNWTG